MVQNKKNREIKVIFLILLVIFLTFLVLPLVRILGKSFVAEGGVTLENYRSILSEKGFLRAPSQTM